MVVIDTDVLMLAFTFHNDKRQATNAAFLEKVKSAEPAITVYNLMEILGQLSFNLSPTQLDDWQTWLMEVYNLSIVTPVSLEDPLATVYFKLEMFDRPYAKMRAERMAFMDALVLSLAERHAGVECFVTWNARHFKGKSPLSVFTPEEYLARQS